jgi:hypothetical protein
MVENECCIWVADVVESNVAMEIWIKGANWNKSSAEASVKAQEVAY